MIIFLQVLKIIGIVLACIIGLIIIIIALVLFAPFSYQIKGQGADENIRTDLTVKWLGGLLNLSGGITGTDVGAFEMKTHFAGLEIKKKENSLVSRIAKRIGLAIWDILKESLFGIKPEKKRSAEEKVHEPEEDDDSPKFIKKIKVLTAKLKSIWEKIKLGKYVLGAPVTARAWSYLKSQLFGILNHLKPKSMEGEITFGMGDPSSTAIGYGLCGWIAPMMDERLVVVPDMDNKTLQMDVVIKGRIFVRFVLSSLWRIITDKNIRRVAGYIGRNL